MTQVLLMGHGSPDRRSHEDLDELRRLVAERLGRSVELGVLEFASPQMPALQAAFARCAGARVVAAQPLVLFSGLHGEEDMPREAAAAAAGLGLDVRLGRPFGDDGALLEDAVGHIRRAAPGEGDVLLFVGRGSSSPVALAQVTEVARRVAERAGLRHVLCHAGISPPDSGAGLRSAAGLEARRVLVLPWLISSGVLLDRVRERTRSAAAEAGVEVVQLPHIGNSPALVEVLSARIEELLRG